MFNIKEIDVFELQQMLADGSEKVSLIDVRSPAEIAQGAIPGAEAMPLHLLPMQMDKLPSDGKIIFYCRTGARSAQACAFAGGQGVDHCYNLRGGIVAWVQGGLAVA